MITFDNVSKIYENTGTVALNNVSFNIDDGEFVFITGESGAGKSTITKLIIAEEKVNNGKIIVDNIDLETLNPKQIPSYRRSIGMIFQDFRLLSTKTVYENIAFALRIVGEDSKAIRDRVLKVLETVDLTDKEKALPDDLSGGERQRVSIARAIVNRPDVLIADEPTGNLDPNMTYEIMSLLEKINEQGTTVLVVTHDNYIVNDMKKRVIQLEKGELVRDDNEGEY